MATDIPLNQIAVSPYQPRREFEHAELAELASSIARSNVFQPIVVRVKGDRYELVAGERRVRASRLIGRETIPAEIRELTDEQAEDICAQENLVRADLTPMDESTLYARYAARGLSSPAIAAKLSRPLARIEFHLRLQNLRPEYQDAVRRKILPMPQGADLARLPHDRQPAFFKKVAAGIDANELARQITAALDLDRQAPMFEEGDPQAAALSHRLDRMLDEVSGKIGACFSRSDLTLLAWVFDGPLAVHLEKIGMIRRELGRMEDALRRAKARKIVAEEQAS